MKNKDQQPTRAEIARSQAAQLICLIFLRVEKDSAAGCALRRALGFSGGSELSQAARDFNTSERSLTALQRKLEGQLGSLAFLSNTRCQ